MAHNLKNEVPEAHPTILESCSLWGIVGKSEFLKNVPQLIFIISRMLLL